MNDRFIGYADFPAKTRPWVSGAPTPGARFFYLLTWFAQRNSELEFAGKMLEKVGRGLAPALPYHRTDIFNESSNSNFPAASGRGAQKM